MTPATQRSSDRSHLCLDPGEDVVDLIASADIHHLGGDGDALASQLGSCPLELVGRPCRKDRMESSPGHLPGQEQAETSRCPGDDGDRSPVRPSRAVLRHSVATDPASTR